MGSPPQGVCAPPSTPQCVSVPPITERKLNEVMTGWGHQQNKPADPVGQKEAKKRGKMMAEDLPPPPNIPKYMTVSQPPLLFSPVQQV